MEKTDLDPTIVKLSEKAKHLPDLPGCYLMKDKKGGILYIGKAKNLKKRVRTYFTQGSKGSKTDYLLQNVKDFSFIIVQSEAEAYVLENNLIKKYSPKYNIKMRDDKSYPYIIIKGDEPYPRPEIIRRPKKNKSDIILGPYPEGTHLRDIVKILIRIFQLRDCTLSEFKRRERPCLLYQMKYCSAPCVSKISEQDYNERIQKVVSFFKGKSQSILKELKDQMNEVAENENFELALILRDEIEKLTHFTEIESQKNAETQNKEMQSMDVWGIAKNQFSIDIVVGQVRDGILLGNNSFHFIYDEAIMNSENEEIFSLLSRYYLNNEHILPKKIVIDLTESQKDLLKNIISSNLNFEVSIASNRYAKSLSEIIIQQANENYRMREAFESYHEKALNSLKSLLQLDKVPRRIECYDIAIWQGKSPTASKVVFFENTLFKKEYRHYKLKEIPEGNNDFLMMKSIIERRFLSEKESHIIPDILLIDGGVGQVSSVLAILKELQLEIPVVGIIKEKVKNKNGTQEISEERLVIPGRKNHYVLKKDIALYRLLTQLRDEAHRFSRRLHHKKEKERTLSSFFDDVEGIGPKTKSVILSKLDLGIDELKSFSIGEIKEKFQISKKVATKIWEKLKAK